MTNSVHFDFFNKGNDISIILMASTGDTINAKDLGHLLDFEASEDDGKTTIKPITRGSRALHSWNPGNGWKGKFHFARRDGRLTKLLIDRAKKYRTEGIEVKWDIQAIVSNPNGTQDKYLWRDCIIHGGGFGGFKGDKEVDQNLNFEASYLEETGGGAGSFSS